MEQARTGVPAIDTRSRDSGELRSREHQTRERRSPDRPSGVRQFVAWGSVDDIAVAPRHGASMA